MFLLDVLQMHSVLSVSMQNLDPMANPAANVAIPAMSTSACSAKQAKNASNANALELVAELCVVDSIFL